MSAWGDRERLPRDWSARVERVKLRAAGRCECDGWCEQHTGRCTRKGSECDHAADRADHRLVALRWLCGPCHAIRSQKQAAQARSEQAALLRHPTPKPPGLV